MSGVLEMTMDEWKKVHKDYKGYNRETKQRSRLMYDPKYGTVSVPVKIVKKIV